jgi:hypothetical protein
MSIANEESAGNTTSFPADSVETRAKDSTMIRATIATSFVAMMLAGCASSGGVGASSRQFDVSLAQADAAVKSLYPSQLEWSLLTSTSDGSVRIRRDELSQEGEVVVLAEQRSASPVKTRIVLKSVGPQRTEISVQASRSKKSVLLPDRDASLEAAKLNAIAEQLSGSTTRKSS